MAVAERFFSPLEVDALRRLPDHARRDLFFRYWTLKESYIKARGPGLAIPLDAFWFTFDRGIEAGVVCSRGYTTVPVRWRFVEIRPTVRHRLAVAVGIPRALDSNVELVQRAFEPC
jgi:4'-phosphopantetheinyl transferase